MNLFATMLTNTAPSANYRGESEQNRLIIQRITRGRFEYAIISPEAMRNALRDQLRAQGLPCNRERLPDEEQLAVRFADYPYPQKFVDDFYFGYLVADRKQIPAAVRQERGLTFKRDSILRMNMAVAIEPYRHDAVFTQSPLTMNSPWKNADSSGLLHRETSYTAYQYPLALNLDDCLPAAEAALPPVDGVTAPGGGTYATRGEQHRDWLRALLQGLGELNGVAGNHARSYFEMAPTSVVVRVTNALAAGYDLYGFRPDGSLPEVIDGITHGDYPGEEFVIGGRIVRDVLDEGAQAALRARGVELHRTPFEALNRIAQRVTGGGFRKAAAAPA